MGSLTGCLSKAGKNITRPDKDAILARAKALRDDGMAPAEAAMQAVDEQIAAVKALMAAPSPVAAVAQAAPEVVEVVSPAGMDAAPSAAAPAPAADPTLDDELNDALSKLGDVLGDVFGAKKNITGPQYGAGDLLPALSKVVELLVRKGFKTFAQSAGKAAQLMRANPKTADHVDAISPRQWKAAYQAIAEGTEGTDSEEAVAATTADQVKAIVGPAPQASDGMATATHKDPGEPAEVVTPSVVAEAIKTAARNEDMTRGQMKVEALRLIDVEIANAPDKGDKKTTISVPGDGTFTVTNNVARLKEFRRQVELSPGFKDKQPGFPISKAVSSANQSADGLAREMLEDGEPVNAVEILEAAGKTMMFGNGNGASIPYTNAEPVEIAGIDDLFVGRGFGTKKGATSWWSVVHKGSGFAIGESAGKKAEAIAEAKKRLSPPENREKMRSLIESGKSADGRVFMTQDELREQFMAEAEGKQQSTFDAAAATQASAKAAEDKKKALDAFYQSIMGNDMARPERRDWTPTLAVEFLTAAVKVGKADSALTFADEVVNDYTSEAVGKWRADHERRNKAGGNLALSPELQTEAEFGAVRQAQAIAEAEREVNRVKTNYVSDWRYKTRAAALRGAEADLKNAKESRPENFAGDHLGAINRAMAQGKMPSAENIRRYDIPASQLPSAQPVRSPEADQAAAKADVAERRRKEAEAQAAAPAIASQTFDQWARAEYAGNEYAASYLEAYEGNENRATLGAAAHTTDNDRSTAELLKLAKQEYRSKLFNLPRETSISLDVWDDLTPAIQIEAQRHFFDLDSRITRRDQDTYAAKAKDEREKKAPYESAFAEVDAEIRRLDKISGPETQKQKDLSGRRERLREAIYQIGQGKEPDGRLLRKVDEPEPLDLMGFTRTPRGNGVFDLSDGNMRVSVEPTERGFYRASFGSGKSGPRLTEQLAVEWAANIRAESKAIQAAPAADMGDVLATGLTSAAFDRWIKPKAERTAAQFTAIEPGVGYFAAAGENKGFKSVAGVVSSRVVADDTRDQRLLYRLDDGSLVWWREEDGTVRKVSASDPRVEVTRDVQPTTDAKEVEAAVTVDGEEYSALFPAPITQLADDQFADVMAMYGFEAPVVRAFERLRAPQVPPSSPKPAPKSYPPAEPATARPDAGAQWDAMTPEQRQAIAAAAGWSTAKGGANPQGKGIARKSWADQVDSTRKRLGDAIEAAQEAPAPVVETVAEPVKIEDVGEKIGGARKDMAESGGTKRKAAADDRPAWARRFQISQIVTPGGMVGTVKDDGRWIIRDTRSLDWTKQPKQVGRNTFATKEEAESFVPLAAVGMKHRPVPTRDGKYEIWREITDRKRVKVVDQVFDTRDEALAHMLANAVQIIETSTTFGEADLPTPPDRARTGPQRRTGNVNGQDFKDTFGLRGVEFGNWNNQDERQSLMNDAWDGLMDLADVMGVPVKALGMNGDLALAFGARGHGLQSARAHYEPGRAVINLTKESGAGSLAHEWFHALDHHFGRQDGKASATWKVQPDGTRMLDVQGDGAEMVSSGFRGDRSGVRLELREAYNAMLRTMTKKAETYVEDTAKADKFVGSAREDLATALAGLRRDLAEQKDPKYWKRNNKPASAEQLAEFDTIAKQMLDGELSMLTTDWRTILKGGDKPASSRGASMAVRWTNDTLERLSVINKEVRGRSGFDATSKSGVMDRLRGSMDRYSQRLKMLADAQAETGKVRAVPTDFAMNARELDQGRGTDYWTSPHEMAARAFQGYVEDKIAERGGVSRFLNYAPENSVILTPWGFKRPYPAGEERKAINAALDKFVGVLETRTDDAGNVSMFSRRAQQPVAMPAVAIAAKLADATTHPLYAAAKAGNQEAALTLARNLVTDEFVREVRDLLGGAEAIIAPVNAQEATGRNKIPAMVAAVLASRLGLETTGGIIQINRPQRTGMDGLDRLFAVPEFDGAVQAGAAYLLVDDTLTQGGTFAALASHITQNGGRVIGAAALTGKRYSATMALSPELLGQVRERFSDVEDAFRAATGYGFDALTESEARYLAAHRSPESVRSRILAQRDAAQYGLGTAGTAEGLDGPFSRARGRGISTRDAQAVKATIRAAMPNAPDILLHESVDQAPKELQEAIRAEGAENDVEAVYWKGEIHAFPKHMADIERALFVMGRHEVRHHGFITRFGGSRSKLDEALHSMWRGNPALREASDAIVKAGRAGEKERAKAIEEALADMPVEQITALKHFDRFVAAVRQWLRDTAAMLRRKGLGALADAIDPKAWTDNDVVAFVSRAEKISGPGGTGGAFSRTTDAFDRWFGQSKVVDENGEPLVVYHGSSADFATFKSRAGLQRESGDGRFGNEGIYFAEDPGKADAYAGRGQVYPVYLSIKNPLVVATGQAFDVGSLAARVAKRLAPKLYARESSSQALRDNMGDSGAYVSEADKAELRRLGYDGIYSQADRVWIALEASQIKSAIGNSSAFDPANPDIRYSRATPAAARDEAGARFSRASNALDTAKSLSLPASYKVGDFMESHGKLSMWDKTVGTPYNLAKRHPRTFGRVYDGVQNFLNDISAYATVSADLAPTILPKLEHMRDIGKTPLSAADSKAIAAPIFEGTLTWTRDKAGKPISMEKAEALAAALTTEEKGQELLKARRLQPGVLRMWQGLSLDQYTANVESRYASEMLRPGVVWTPAELKAQFGLTAKQIGLYQEFRKATDKSLDDLSVSEMLRIGGANVAGMADAVRGMPAADAAVLLRDRLWEMAEQDADREKVLNKAADTIMELGNKVADLKDRGYAPLSRFGHYTLDVVNPDGERVYFGLFESQPEAARMARQMRAQYPDAAIRRGTQDTEGFKMFTGISPETLELFGEILGLDATGDGASDQAFQTYLQRAKSSRSAMKRLIHRKGIAGFNEDAGRVLAGFITSNARRTSSNLHMKEIVTAVNDMPQQEGELKTYAAKMVDYVQNPIEEAAGFRGLLFAQYLGGSIASALVNMTQPISVSFPWLSQHGGARKAAGQLATAFKDMASGKKLEPALAAAMKHAEEQGIVAPQEIHQLQAQARGQSALKSGDGTKAGDAMATASNALSKFSLAWGQLFGFAEAINRRSTFIAAFRTAVEQGMPDPDGFAANAVTETQFVYGKGNRPAWARGPVGATLFTFKTYSISYIELLVRMAKNPDSRQAAMLAMAVLLLMGGADGLPFMEDVEDLIDGFMQRVLGLNWSTKQKRNELLAEVLGEDLARFLKSGVSGLPGAPIDVSGRMGMPNLIPGTGLLRKDSQGARDLKELFGPAGDLVERAGKATGMALQGDFAKAAIEISPVAARNVVKAADMLDTGMYRDATGKKVIETTTLEAIAKAAGFQPNTVARVQEATYQVQRGVALNKKVEGEIAALWALGVFEKDAAKVERAREQLQTWNEDNKTSPIRITMPQVLKRVRAMREDKTTRIAKTAPAEIRAQVKRELETP